MPISAASDALFSKFGSELLTAVGAIWRVIVTEFTVRAIAVQIPDFGPSWGTARQTSKFEHATTSMHVFEFWDRFVVEVSEFRDVTFTLRALRATCWLGITERCDFVTGVRFTVHARVVQLVIVRQVVAY